MTGRQATEPSMHTGRSVSLRPCCDMLTKGDVVGRSETLRPVWAGENEGEEAIYGHYCQSADNGTLPAEFFFPKKPFLATFTPKFLTLKASALSIAAPLHAKNIPFCLYRFPREETFRLAVPPEVLPHPKGQTFWMAPFCTQSKAKPVYLAVVQEAFIQEPFSAQVQTLPLQAELPDCPLPPATTKTEYLSRIHAFLKDIRSGLLDKAILSRVFYEEKPQDFDLFACFQRLADAYPETFVHLSVHPESGIWIGATPELLLKKRGPSVAIMALAGTQPRKQTAGYQWREKEMEEHLMVGRHIEATFAAYGCELAERDGPNTIERAKVAHLNTDYTFKTPERFPIQSFLSELHPTPAVGGLPVDKGVDCILAHEGYDRRYYCGFIGETDFETTADLYINLRCMQIGKEKIAIYVGGGITAASDPEEEWQETVMKSKTMVDQIKEGEKS